ncbi:solute carrier family 2, facilitated glucose transporter member 11-like [Amblyraja radiata]|uniref:solute carrier family 2, facilitated glucose transporter member 11-like n=1 Tax=Amblyraja radiata TaxID=386614 RepID=UPI001403D888|nr:solute carrier family 2, facilitated glucose transporter member 11-like [Amblyraja radiata]
MYRTFSSEMDSPESAENLRDIKLPSLTIVMAMFSAGIGGSFQTGYNTSIINAPTMEVQAFINETWTIRNGTNLQSGLLKLLWSVIVSVFTLGGFLGTWLGGYMAGKFGRKGTLLLANVFTLAGSVFMGASKPAGIFELLIVGRFLVGLHAGASLCVQPMYLGEIAPKVWRGVISMGTSLFLTLGILVGQIMGLRELLGGEHYWHILLSTICIPALIQLLMLPWCPESPRYLFIDKGLEAEAVQSLKQLHGANSYLSELEDMEKEWMVIHLQPSKGLWGLLKDRLTRWQLITVMVMNAGLQLSGINVIYFYATYIFSAAGIAPAYIPYVTMGTGVCECFSALCCSLLIEWLGRRVLIIGGYFLMAVWCAVITITLTYQDSYFLVPYMTMTFLFAFILSFGLGPGGVTNTVTGELFTQKARPAAYMASGAISWLSFFLVSMTFPLIVETMQHLCFLIFLVVCLLVSLFVYVVLPETKNKTFVEIEKEFWARNLRCGLPIAPADGIMAGVTLAVVRKP